MNILYVVKSKKSMLIALFLASVVMHFSFYGYPKDVVFDEVHFGKFINGYYTGEYFFDIHPPLGKLLIAGFGKLVDFKPEFSYAEIGNEFPDSKYLALRFLPTLAGTLLPLVILLLTLEMGFSRRAGLFAGLCVLLDGALLVQSRFILLDAFLLLFGFSALWMYLRYRNTDKPRNLLAAGVLAAMAASVKWTGVSFLAIIALIEFVEIIRNREFVHHFRRKIIFLTIIPVLFYFSVFAVHFLLLAKTGPGDAFMSPGFQKTLLGNRYYNDGSVTEQNIVASFAEVNAEMFLSNQRLNAEHPYSSKWYTWPLMLRPIYYWMKSGDTAGTAARIYLFGNIIIWWGSATAVILAFILLLLRGAFREPVLGILCGGFLLNIIPFMGITRPMFLYHYFIPLVFAIMILAYIADKKIPDSKMFMVIFLGLAILAFALFTPVIYGFTLSDAHFNRLMFLQSWR